MSDPDYSTVEVSSPASATRTRVQSSLPVTSRVPAASSLRASRQREPHAGKGGSQDAPDEESNAGKAKILQLASKKDEMAKKLDIIQHALDQRRLQMKLA